MYREIYIVTPTIHPSPSTQLKPVLLGTEGVRWVNIFKPNLNYPNCPIMFKSQSSEVQFCKIYFNSFFMCQYLNENCSNLMLFNLIIESKLMVLQWTIWQLWLLGWDRKHVTDSVYADI